MTIASPAASGPARTDGDAAGTLPPPVREVAERLRAAGHEAYLVGGCVRDALLGLAVRDFDLATSASAGAVLALFPRAVATGVRHGTVMVVTSAGPVDVTTYRAGGTLTADLAHRDFTVNAMAVDPTDGRLHDPFGGREDLGASRLRAVGSARERLAEDPLRALRAARLLATLGLVPDTELEEALATSSLAGVARERIGAEMAALLTGARAGPALGLLARTGIAGALAPGVLADAAEVVGALPPDLPLRLAAWLRGTRAPRVLATLRLPRRVGDDALALLRLHPVESTVDPQSDTSVRRLLQRADGPGIERLLALRRAELGVGAAAQRSDAPESRARLDALERGIARVRSAGTLALHRLDLALDGGDVMEALRCRPGRHVGEALRFLTDRVLEDPSRNTRDALLALLADWARDRTGIR